MFATSVWILTLVSRNKSLIDVNCGRFVEASTLFAMSGEAKSEACEKLRNFSATV